MEANDSLFMLSLEMMPLKTKGLLKARLVKNSRLEGMVELFNDTSMGSGQIPTSQLNKVFSFDEHNENDLTIIKKLSALPSYDIYSLRIQLRQLGIDVDQDRHLRLSEQRAKELNSYMMVFLKPLMATIYRGSMNIADEFIDWNQVLAEPPVANAWENLRNLAKALGVEIQAIPEFLRDYGDVYLSLAFYQHCHEHNKMRLNEFFKSLTAIQATPYLMSDPTLRQECAAISAKFQLICSDVDGVLDIFKTRTEDMWENISDNRFREMERTIKDYQVKIGGALCALSIKMKAWQKAFPDQDAWSLSKRAEFIMSDMRQGLQKIEPIRYDDAA